MGIGRNGGVPEPWESCLFLLGTSPSLSSVLSLSLPPPPPGAQCQCFYPPTLTLTLTPTPPPSSSTFSVVSIPPSPLPPVLVGWCCKVGSSQFSQVRKRIDRGNHLSHCTKEEKGGGELLIHKIIKGSPLSRELVSTLVRDLTSLVLFQYIHLLPRCYEYVSPFHRHPPRLHFLSSADSTSPTKLLLRP